MLDTGPSPSRGGVDKGVLWPRGPSIAHSLASAQEFL